MTPPDPVWNYLPKSFIPYKKSVTALQQKVP